MNNVHINSQYVILNCSLTRDFFESDFTLANVSLYNLLLLADSGTSGNSSPAKESNVAKL